MASKYLLLGMAVVLAATAILGATPALAAPYCINNSWSGNTIGPVMDILGPELCPFGCDNSTGACGGSQWQVLTGPIGNWGVAGMVMFFIVLVILLGWAANKYR